MFVLNKWITSRILHDVSAITFMARNITLDSPTIAQTSPSARIFVSAVPSVNRNVNDDGRRTIFSNTSLSLRGATRVITASRCIVS